MKKLQSKNQPIEQQEQASRAIQIYYSTFKTKKGSEDNSQLTQQTDEVIADDITKRYSQWQSIFEKLHPEIKTRGYSQKTYATYAN